MCCSDEQSYQDLFCGKIQQTWKEEPRQQEEEIWRRNLEIVYEHMSGIVPPLWIIVG